MRKFIQILLLALFVSNAAYAQHFVKEDGNSVVVSFIYNDSINGYLWSHGSIKHTAEFNPEETTTYTLEK